jgi:hypothetical protein
MKKAARRGRSVMRLACVAAGVALLGVVIVAGAYEKRGREAFRESERAEAQDQLGMLRSNLQGVLNDQFAMARSLAAVVRFQPGLDQAGLDRLGTELLAGVPSIRNVSLAPDLVVRLVHPLAGNESIVGLDLSTMPRELAAIQLVRLDGFDFLSRPPQEGRGFQLEWDKYVRFIAWLRAENPEVGELYGPILEGGMARLQSLWPDNRPEGLVWGDSRMGNMMFDENFDVVAVLDWEQPSLGGALHDLAWFSVISDTMHGPGTRVGQYLEGMGTRDELIALWEEVSGKSAAELAWYEEFAHLKMSCTGVRLGQLRGTFMMDAPTMARRLKIA